MVEAVGLLSRSSISQRVRSERRKEEERGTNLENLALELFHHLGLQPARDDAIQAEQAEDSPEWCFLVDELADRVLLSREVDAGDEVWEEPR